MEITWLGHSCFRLRGKQATVITDPFPLGLGYSLGKVTADIVTVSHNHSDHSNVAEVGGQPRVISGPGEYEISGVLATGFQTYHDSEHGALRGKNTVYLMELDELVICHLGDLGHALSAEQVSRIEDADVLLVPVGGVKTIDGEQAAALVRHVEPKIVIPMHYKTEALTKELETVERFLKEMGVKEAVPQAKLNVNKNSLPVTLQVALLSYRES